MYTLRLKCIVDVVSRVLYSFVLVHWMCFTVDEIFVQYMHSYLLTEEQLVQNGYPRPTSDPGVASIVRKPDDNSSDIKPVGPNGMYSTVCVHSNVFLLTYVYTVHVN